MTTVAMSATTAAAATPATSFFARVSIIAGTGGCEGGKFLVEPRGATMRAFRAAPVGGTDEDFGIAFALHTMKFVDRHGAKIVFAAAMFKRGTATGLPRPGTFEFLFGERIFLPRIAGAHFHAERRLDFGRKRHGRRRRGFGHSRTGVHNFADDGEQF